MLWSLCWLDKEVHSNVAIAWTILVVTSLLWMIFCLRINFVSILNIQEIIQRCFWVLILIWCQSILNDKITISLYHNDKLDVENENSRFNKFAVKCKLNERGWQTPCEIATYVSDFHNRSILFNQEFAYITTFEYRRLIDKTFGCCNLVNYENRWRRYDNIQNSFTNYICILL